jgi:hypothetical protein
MHDGLHTVDRPRELGGGCAREIDDDGAGR